MKRYVQLKPLEETVSKDFKKDVLNKPLEFRYQMLGRLIQDVDYYLKNPHPKYLWAGDPIEHADDIIALYKSFSSSEKPEWLTDKELKNYVNKLKKMR